MITDFFLPLWRTEHNKTVTFQALTKELEARSGLKVAVIGAGAQLVELREADGASDVNLEDKETESDPDLCSVHSQLRQVELDWSRLLADVPVVQQALHQVTKITRFVLLMCF